MPTIDLNSDLGEGVGDDAAMFGIVTSANVACGLHAGDGATMLASARLALQNHTSLGVHPSYRDREGFGRRDTEIEAVVLARDIREQIDALQIAAETAGAEVRYLKPHGALYNRIAIDPVQADAVARAAQEAGLPLLGLGGTAIQTAADHLGVPFYLEAFADRAYLPDGTLAPRSLGGAVINDPVAAAERALIMVLDGTVQAIDGTTIRMRPDSLCVHGDTPGAVAMAALVREKLLAAGVELRAFV